MKKRKGKRKKLKKILRGVIKKENNGKIGNNKNHKNKESKLESSI